MKKVIKLTERDLMNIVKRVINEQSLSLEAKLIEKGFEKNKNMLVKKIPGVGDFYFNLKNNGAEITILNPNNQVIRKFNSNFNLNSSNKIKLGFKSDVEAERISDVIIKSFGTSGTTPPQTPILPMEEERFDFEKMSDEELHDLHPHIKKHPRHFEDFTPKSEYLGWRGEVDKRNLYKSSGKFHNAFDKKTEY
jgi:hypothetical protein